MRVSNNFIYARINYYKHINFNIIISCFSYSLKKYCVLFSLDINKGSNPSDE